MPVAGPPSAIVTHAVDILTAAGFRVHRMQGSKHIDRDEYEATIAGLADRAEIRDGGAVVITGTHDDHGRTELRREVDVFTIWAEDLSLV